MGNLPSTEGFSKIALRELEERQIPQAIEHKLVPNIEVGRTTVEALLTGIGLLRPAAKRRGVDTLAPPIGAIDGESVSVHLADMKEHGVEIGIDVGQGEEDAIEIRVPRQTRCNRVAVHICFLDHLLSVGTGLPLEIGDAVEGITRGEAVHIDGADQVVSGTGFITERNEQVS